MHVGFRREGLKLKLSLGDAIITHTQSHSHTYRYYN